MTRLSIEDFSTNNPLYTGATVGVLAVSDDPGDEIYLELFAEPTGGATLANPQVLNSQGRWARPIYVGADYRLSVAGSTFEDHMTGARRLGVLTIKQGDGIAVNAEAGEVTVAVANPFTADEKQKLAAVTRFNLWNDVETDLGDQIANEDRFVIGQASNENRRNGFITGRNLKRFIGALAGSFKLWTSVPGAIGTDIADDDRMLVGDKSAIGQINKWASIANLKSVFASRFSAMRRRTDYTVLDPDYGRALFFNTAGASRTVTLPARAAGDAGFRVWIVKSTAANALMVVPDADAGDTINGANELAMTRLLEAVLVTWTGTEWLVISHVTPGLSGFDLYEEITTALVGSLSADDLFAIADVSEGGRPNRAAKAAQIRDFIFPGKLAKSVAGDADISLSRAEAAYGALEFTGALTGDVILTIPTQAAGLRLVTRDTTGDYELLAKVSGQADSAAVTLVDGKNVLEHDGEVLRHLNVGVQPRTQIGSDQAVNPANAGRYYLSGITITDQSAEALYKIRVFSIIQQQQFFVGV